MNGEELSGFCVCAQWLSLSLTLFDPVDCSPPVEFSRQEFWSGLPFPSPGDLPDPGIEPKSPEAPASAGGATEPSGKPLSVF